MYYLFFFFYLHCYLHFFILQSFPTRRSSDLYYFLRGMLNPAFGAAGGDELLADLTTGEEGAWTSSVVLETMEKVQEMEEAGMFDSGVGALNHTQSQMNFLLHENAFIPVGFWLPNEMEDDIPDGFDFGFIPSPIQDAG